MSSAETDVVVIGGGPGGYVCAIRLAQLQKRVTVIEKDSLGGVCLNWGCIPSKTLLHVAKKLDELGHLSEIGINAEFHSVDFSKINLHKNEVVQSLNQGIQNLFRQHRISSLFGNAQFVSDHEVDVKARDGVVNRIAFQQAVLAVGSRPARLFKPEIPDFDGKTIITSSEALNLDRIPRQLIVIGGGVIGLEIATIFQKLGSEITIFEYTPHLMPGSDRDAVKLIESRLRKRKANIFVNCDVRKINLIDAGCVVEAVDRSGDGLIEATGEKVLIAVGRTPNTDHLNAAVAGIELDSRGFVITNDRLMTSNPNVYAIGDVIGPPLLAHKASKEGIIAAEVIAGLPVGRDFQCVPLAAFTDPEFASVGYSEEELKVQQMPFEIARFPYSAIGRSLTTGQTEGFIKIVFSPESRSILNIAICGANASDLISEGALAIEMGATLDDLAMTVHPHPTLSELYSEGAEAALGHPIHIFRPIRKKPL